ncbi:MAG: hypothetical protein F6K28_48970, partial [Microcoleus sp. SIO2G3]|nr:hypothetical protein [Microcoleus sp. SIO2G3]
SPATGQRVERPVQGRDRAFDLWLVNFHAQAQPQAHDCRLDDAPPQAISGYDYRQYHCF